MLTKEEFIAKSIEITENITNQAKVNTLLHEMTSGYDKVIDENSNLKSLNESLTKSNNELKESNMDFYLKLQNQNKDLEKEEKENQKDSLEGAEDKEQPKMNYEDLFDEKGDWK